MSDLIRGERSNYFSNSGRFLLASVFVGVTFHTKKIQQIYHLSLLNFLISTPPPPSQTQA